MAVIVSVEPILSNEHSMALAGMAVATSTEWAKAVLQTKSIVPLLAERKRPTVH